MLNRALALFKQVLSYRKTRWTFRDYPVRVVRRRADDLDEAPEGEAALPWRAYIVGWRLTGTGASKAEARADLRQLFEAYVADRTHPPRPGKRQPYDIASRERLEAVEHLAPEFFRSVLKMDYEMVLITDLSTIWHFPVDETPAEMARKLMLRYGVDVGDLVEEGLVVAVLERIAAQGRTHR